MYIYFSFLYLHFKVRFFKQKPRDMLVLIKTPQIEICSMRIFTRISCVWKKLRWNEQNQISINKHVITIASIPVYVFRMIGFVYKTHFAWISIIGLVYHQVSSSANWNNDWMFFSLFLASLRGMYRKLVCIENFVLHANVIQCKLQSHGPTAC